jgi:hypothetical protein
MIVTLELPVSDDALRRQIERGKIKPAAGLLAFRSEAIDRASPRILNATTPFLHRLSVAIDPDSTAGRLILDAFAEFGFYPDGDRGNVDRAYEI